MYGEMDLKLFLVLVMRGGCGFFKEEGGVGMLKVCFFFVVFLFDESDC